MLLAFGLDVNEYDVLLLGLVFFWLSAVPLSHYVIAGHQTDRFPYFPIVVFFATVSYAFPVFFIKCSSYEVAPLTRRAMWMAILGYGSFYFSYVYFNQRVKMGRGFQPLRQLRYVWQLKQLAFIFYLIYLINRVFPIDSVKYVAEYGFYVYFGAYIYLINTRKRIAKLEYVVFFSTLIFETLFRVLSGYVASFFLFAVYISIVYYLTSGKFRGIILIGLAFMALYALYAPAKYRYRKQVEFAKRKLTMEAKARILWNNILHSQQVKKSVSVSGLSRDRYSVFWRGSYQASALALIMEKVPGTIPFHFGDTYIILPKLVPRILWKDKPEDLAALKFDKAFHLVSPKQKNSIYPLPLLGEFYLNFGFWGGIIGMGLLGFLYVCINGYFNQRKTSGINSIFSAAVIFPFVYHEGNLTMLFGNIPLLSLVIFVVSQIYIAVSGKVKEKLSRAELAFHRDKPDLIESETKFYPRFGQLNPSSDSLPGRNTPDRADLELRHNTKL